jgi:hypothetical protein
MPHLCVLFARQRRASAPGTAHRSPAEHPLLEFLTILDWLTFDWCALPSDLKQLNQVEIRTIAIGEFIPGPLPRIFLGMTVAQRWVCEAALIAYTKSIQSPAGT